MKLRSALCGEWHPAHVTIRSVAPAGPPLEPLGLHRQQVLDVRAAREDAFQVDPAPLHINPHVEQSHDAVQLVLPAQGILFENLMGRRRKNSH